MAKLDAFTVRYRLIFGRKENVVNGRVMVWHYLLICNSPQAAEHKPPQEKTVLHMCNMCIKELY